MPPVFVHNANGVIAVELPITIHAGRCRLKTNGIPFPGGYVSKKPLVSGQYTPGNPTGDFLEWNISYLSKTTPPMAIEALEMALKGFSNSFIKTPTKSTLKTTIGNFTSFIDQFISKHALAAKQLKNLTFKNFKVFVSNAPILEQQIGPDTFIRIEYRVQPGAGNLQPLLFIWIPIQRLLVFNNLSSPNMINQTPHSNQTVFWFPSPLEIITILESLALLSKQHMTDIYNQL